MTCAIVYSSRTGNTKQLAEAVRASLGEQTCLYMGPPDDRALTADRLYVGFWTDKGTCDAATAGFLSKVSGKENTLIGSFMCQGRMPMAVRERYEKMCSAPSSPGMPDPKKMLENFDRALQHPDAEDLSHLTSAVTAGCKPV